MTAPTIPPTEDEKALFRHVSESAAVVRYVVRTRPGRYPVGSRLPDEAIAYGYAAFRPAPTPCVEHDPVCPACGEARSADPLALCLTCRDHNGVECAECGAALPAPTEATP